MDILQLRYVSTLAKTCSFSRASEQLFISQSNLSQQITKLENEIGYPLFARTTKSVALTQEGENFLFHANKVLDSYGDLEKHISATNAAMEHTINLGTSVIYRPRTSALLSKFIQDHPEIDINLITAWELDLVDMLHDGLLDVAIFGVDRENDDLSDMTVVPFHSELVAAVISKEDPLSKKDTITIEDVKDKHLLFTSRKSAVRRLVLQKFQQEGVIPKKITEIEENETRMYWVMQQMGVSFAMNSTHMWLGKRGIKVIPLAPSLVRTYSLVYTKEGARRHPEMFGKLKYDLIEALQDEEFKYR